jgi:hypothetical protein
MSSEILNKPVSNGHMEKFSGQEKKELRSWLPETIGRVMFSWYFD